jgi:hypothetical protein
MSATVRRVDYFYLMIEDRPGAACRILETLAQAEVNLLAFSVIPTGTSHTQLVVFPEHSDKLARAAEKEGFVLTGPQRALMTSGDDRLGALVDIHLKLADAGVNVYAAHGVTDERGGYGYIFHVRPDEFENAARVLGV